MCDSGENVGEGTYTLLVELSAPARLTFGAAGERDLAAGWYAYTGSALGPGGFARVERHRELARGERDVRHWHVDSLLGHPATRVADDVRTSGVEAECGVASRVGSEADPVSGVGATDCRCGSHLAYLADRERLTTYVERAHVAVE